MARLRLLVLVLAAVASPAFAACGGDGDGDEAGAGTDVNQLLEQTFAGNKKVDSGKLDLSLRIDAQGKAAKQLQGPVSIKLAGPFQSRGEGKLPKFKMDLSFSGAGQNLKAGATSTGDKGFVNFQGSDYAVSKQVFRQFQAGFEQAQKQAKQNSKQPQSLATLGIDPRRWLSNAKNAGEAKVGDDDAIKITGDVNVTKLLDDVDNALGRARSLGIQGSQDLPSKLTPKQRKQITDAVEDLSVEIYTGKDDKILRRLLVQLGIEVPRSEGGGSADIAFDLQLTDLNEDQEIAAPSNPKPFDQLLGSLGGLGLGGGSGGSGGSGSADSDALKKYSDCIAKAGNDAAKARKCADLLATP